MGIFDKLFGRKKVEETTKPNNEKLINLLNKWSLNQEHDD